MTSTLSDEYRLSNCSLGQSSIVISLYAQFSLYKEIDFNSNGLHEHHIWEHTNYSVQGK